MDPPSWMNSMHLGAAGPVRAMSADVSTTAAETDQVYRIGGARGKGGKRRRNGGERGRNGMALRSHKFLACKGLLT